MAMQYEIEKRYYFRKYLYMKHNDVWIFRRERYWKMILKVLFLINAIYEEDVEGQKWRRRRNITLGSKKAILK